MSLNGITEFADAFRRARTGPADPPVVLAPEPRDTAARVAAPWWALAWLLTLGRMGEPLFRVERDSRQAERLARLRAWSPGGMELLQPGVSYQPFASTTDPANPPRGGSGVPWPGPDPGMESR